MELLHLLKEQLFLTLADILHKKTGAIGLRED